MRIKYFFISVGLLLSVELCQSQNRFGIFAGVQMTSARYRVTDIKQPTEFKYGFQAGVGWKIPFDNHLFFSPAAFYSLKGYKVKYNRSAFPPDIDATDNNTTIHSFELAFLLQFDFGDQPTHFFIKAGPSIDFQLAGHEKFHLKNGSLVDRSMTYGFTQYGRYSVNLLTQFGVETKSGLTIFAQVSPGLGNLNNADGGPVIKHRVYGLSVGKFLRKKM